MPPRPLPPVRRGGEPRVPRERTRPGRRFRGGEPLVPPRGVARSSGESRPLHGREGRNRPRDGVPRLRSRSRHLMKPQFRALPGRNAGLVAHSSTAPRYGWERGPPTRDTAAHVEKITVGSRASRGGRGLPSICGSSPVRTRQRVGAEAPSGLTSQLFLAGLPGGWRAAEQWALPSARTGTVAGFLAGATLFDGGRAMFSDIGVCAHALASAGGARTVRAGSLRPAAARPGQADRRTGETAER